MDGNKFLNTIIMTGIKYVKKTVIWFYNFITQSILTNHYVNVSLGCFLAFIHPFNLNPFWYNCCEARYYDPNVYNGVVFIFACFWIIRVFFLASFFVKFLGLKNDTKESCKKKEAFVRERFEPANKWFLIFLLGLLLFWLGPAQYLGFLSQQYGSVPILGKIFFEGSLIVYYLNRDYMFVYNLFASIPFFFICFRVFVILHRKH